MEIDVITTIIRVGECHSAFQSDNNELVIIICLNADNSYYRIIFDTRRLRVFSILLVSIVDCNYRFEYSCWFIEQICYVSNTY